MDCLPWKTFHRIVDRCDGDRSVKSLTCAEQFRVMAFAPLTDRERVRDSEVCLSAQSSKPGRATSATGVASSWSTHPPRWIRRLSIGACRSFLGRCFVAPKSAVQRHTVLALRGTIPSVLHLSDGTLGDGPGLDVLVLEAGAISVMDRGSLDCSRLYVWPQAHAFCVTRTTSTTRLRRVDAVPVERSTGISCDQTVALTGATSRKDDPEHLRRIRCKDPNTGKTLVFLPNNCVLSAATLCALDYGTLAGGIVRDVDHAACAYQDVVR